MEQDFQRRKADGLQNSKFAPTCQDQLDLQTGCPDRHEYKQEKDEERGSGFQLPLLLECCFEIVSLRQSQAESGLSSSAAVLLETALIEQGSGFAFD
jgi:hypothetical protein